MRNKTSLWNQSLQKAGQVSMALLTMPSGCLSFPPCLLMGYLSWNYWFFTTGKLKTLLAKAYALLLTEELSIYSFSPLASWFLRQGLTRPRRS